MITREDIFDALFQLVAGAQVDGSPAFKTTSRKLLHWDRVVSADQPALFITQARESAMSKIKLPTVWTLRASIFIYAHQNSLDTLPSTALNNLIDAVEQQLAPDWTGEQTLGGLALQCRIVGDIETDEGVLGDQAIAIINVEILAAGETSNYPKVHTKAFAPAFS
jgi:hypothetical protein